MKLSDLQQSIAIRTMLLLVLYVLVLWSSWWFARELRFDFDVLPEFRESRLIYWPLVLILKLACLYLFGQFAGLLSYFSIPDLRRIFYSSAVSAGILFQPSI